MLTNHIHEVGKYSDSVYQSFHTVSLLCPRAGEHSLSLHSQLISEF
jgi:hypothetical protein